MGRNDNYCGKNVENKREVIKSSIEEIVKIMKETDIQANERMIEFASKITDICSMQSAKTDINCK